MTHSFIHLPISSVAQAPPGMPPLGSTVMYGQQEEAVSGSLEHTPGQFQPQTLTSSRNHSTNSSV